MADEGKTREQLLGELAVARRRVAELEASRARGGSDPSPGEPAEQTALDSGPLLQSIFRVAPTGIGMVHNRVLFEVNQRICEMTGYSQQELIGQSARILYPTVEDFDYVGLEKYRQIAAGGTGEVETHWQRKDGTIIDVLLASTPLNPLDLSKGVTFTALDITERKRAEEHRRKLEAQVQQAQKLESLGILAGGIAHDFNNILTGLLGNIELVLHDLPADSPMRKRLGDVWKAGRRATDLTSQMLAYSGKATFVVEDVDLSLLVRDMGSLLESSTSKKVALRYELRDELPAVTADATQLRQIVLNLVTNASDAVGDTGGLVHVRTYVADYDRAALDGALPARELSGGTYVVLEISDPGCGMDAETQAQIFDPFFTTKFTGRGLGLAAVLGIIRGHKGAVLIDSEPGRGTTFKVLLPALNRPAAVVVARAQDSDWCGTGTLLLVDDEEAVRAVTGAMAKLLGFSVLQAADGLEAVELFREHHHELACVLLDLTMPRMDGADAFAQIRKIGSRVPVILTSGYSELESAKRLGDRGFAGFMQKPYGVAALRSKLRQVLGDPSSRLADG